MSLTYLRPFLTEINTAGYEDGRSTSSSEDLSAIAMRFIDEYFSLFAAWTIVHRIYSSREKMMMTSETSENTMLIRLYFTLCYRMLNAKMSGETIRGLVRGK